MFFGRETIRCIPAADPPVPSFEKKNEIAESRGRDGEKTGCCCRGIRKFTASGMDWVFIPRHCSLFVLGKIKLS
jgi:hypothetical protein